MFPKLKKDARIGLISIIIIWMTMNCCSLKSNIVVNKDFSPIIESVQTVKIEHGKDTVTSSFRTGEKANFIIVALDLNKDIEKLYIKGFSTKGPEIRLNFESGPVELTPHTKKIDSYMLPYPIEIPGPPGKWRVDIQIEDREKNKSNIYTLYAIVH